MEDIHRILVITLSNIGDVVLTTPVIKVLRNSFPHAYMAVMCSDKVAEIFLSDPKINEVIKYDKHTSLLNKIGLGFRLRKKRFDIVIDLRHTLFPLLLKCKYRTSILNVRRSPYNIHKKDFHLNRLKELNLSINISPESPYIYIPKKVKHEVDSILQKTKLSSSCYIVISPGGRSKSKLWPKDNFLKLCRKIINTYKYKILLVGDAKDQRITHWIVQNMDQRVVNLAGRTTLLQLAELLIRAKVLITNDSGTLHIGSAVKIPIVALFGPTNEVNYGPLGKNSIAIKAESKYSQYNPPSLDNISVSKVYESVRRILG